MSEAGRVPPGPHIFSCIDGHTCGNPVRLVFGGGPLLVGVAVFGARTMLLTYALIWTAHIGMDRLLGFGLKYPTRFQDTHLQRI